MRIMLTCTSHSAYLCKFIVSGGAGETEQTLPLLCVFVDAASLVQQLPHGVDVPVGTGLGQTPAENNQTATITASVM